jgi:hypothetical protein
MTRTCALCNNRLGSYVEADLVDWFEDAITFPYFRSGGVKGRRRSGRILFRTTPDEKFVLVIDGASHPDIASMLASGEVDLEACRPDRNRYSIALLKQAYLAACLTFGILEHDRVAAVRRDLLAARKAGSRDEVPPSALALGLTVLRRYEPVERAIAPVVGPCCTRTLDRSRVLSSLARFSSPGHRRSARRSLRRPAGSTADST